MKTLLLYGTLLLLPLVADAQQSKDNAIIISAAGITEEKVVMALISSGFPLEVYALKYHLSGPVQRNSTTMKVAVYLDGSNYVLHGWYDENMSSTTMKQDFQLISYGGSKLSITRRSWNELMKVANKISKTYSYTQL